LRLVKPLHAEAFAVATLPAASLVTGGELLGVGLASAGAAGAIAVDKPLGGEAQGEALPLAELRMEKGLSAQAETFSLALGLLSARYPGSDIGNFVVYGADVFVDGVTAEISTPGLVLELSDDPIYADIEVLYVDYRKAA
jgi:hypothetical protein